MSETTAYQDWLDERHGLVGRQFVAVLERVPDATLTVRAYGGSHVVRVPSVRLEGYRERETWVEFVLPIGFPMACPADFHTGDVRLESGRIPFNVYPAAEGREHMLWLHRLLYWRPNQDTILTYLHTVMRRLNGHPTIWRAPTAGETR